MENVHLTSEYVDKSTQLRVMPFISRKTCLQNSVPIIELLLLTFHRYLGIISVFNILGG